MEYRNRVLPLSAAMCFATNSQDRRRFLPIAYLFRHARRTMCRKSAGLCAVTSGLKIACASCGVFCEHIGEPGSPLRIGKFFCRLSSTRILDKHMRHGCRERVFCYRHACFKQVSVHTLRKRWLLMRPLFARVQNRQGADSRLAQWSICRRYGCRFRVRPFFRLVGIVLFGQSETEAAGELRCSS